ncbi:MAG: FtsX-like permease family protein [Dehalococcoidales bacterium]
MSRQLTAFVSMKTIERLSFPGTYNSLEIVAPEEFNNLAKLEAVADELKDKLRSDGIFVGSVNILEPGEHWGRETSQSFTLILNFIGIFALLISGFLVVNTISALLTQQRRQVGMMKAVGGTGRQTSVSTWCWHPSTVCWRWWWRYPLAWDCPMYLRQRLTSF